MFGLFLPGTVEHSSQAILKFTPIDQARKGVVSGEVIELVGGGALLGAIAKGHHGTGQLAIFFDRFYRVENWKGGTILAPGNIMPALVALFVGQTLIHKGFLPMED